MSTVINCRQCAKRFEQKRSDHLFCSAKCVAAYYRDNPNPDYIHAEKEHTHFHFCEECGVPFAVNDYAQRGGKRAPTYCSPKCKQKAYRTRGKSSQEQAERRYKTEGANRDEYDQQRRESERKQREERQRYDREQAQRRTNQSSNTNNQRANTGQSTGDQRQKDPFEHLSKHEKAYLILGVSEPFTKQQLRKAYYAAMKKVHPDVYKGEDATQKAQMVNWAYEFLK